MTMKCRSHLRTVLIVALSRRCISQSLSSHHLGFKPDYSVLAAGKNGRRCRLFAKRAALACGKIQMQVVAMGFIGFRTEHRSEYPAGAFVHAAEELSFPR
jgi:hypothetical protein